MSAALHAPGSAGAADLTVRACVLLQEAIEADSLGRVNTAAGLIEDAQHALAQIETSPGRVVLTELELHNRIAAATEVLCAQLAVANAKATRLEAYTAELRATSFQAVTVLREIVTETMDYPPVRPVSDDSWVPRDMVARAQAALAPFQLDVPTYQAMGAPLNTIPTAQPQGIAA